MAKAAAGAVTGLNVDCRRGGGTLESCPLAVLKHLISREHMQVVWGPASEAQKRVHVHVHAWTRGAWRAS